ncbi:TPA: hypothetical protein DF272_03630 [Candidatus Falkowbacteria bacterium]|nr:hypothetical protein [Candidatus Falkowbacteria bacterium]
MTKIAHVTPLRKLPREMDYFDYIIPDKLAAVVKVGSLVEIPFKQSMVQGLVVGIDKESKFKKLKMIDDIIDSELVLPEWQINFIKWFADYYFYSLSSTVRMFVPEKPKLKRKAKEPAIGQISATVKHNKEIDKLGQLLMKKSQRENLIINHDQEKNNQLIINLIEQTVTAGRQIIIMVPHVEKIKDVLQIIPEKFSALIAVVDSGLFRQKNAWHEAWRNIRLNQKQIIVGTRSALLTPVDDLAYVYINEAESIDYKNWDQNPRYHGTTLARKMAELTGAKVILSSPAPNIEDYFVIKKNNQPIITLGANIKTDELQIIDLNSVRRKEFTYYSPQLLDNIRRTLATGKRVVLFLNKRGFSSQTRCNACDFIAKCPSCDLPLVSTETELVCYSCQHREPALTVCPKCHRGQLKDLGLGIDQAAADLKGEFAGVSIADPKARIYLTTTLPTDKTVFNDVAFIGVISWDSMLYLTDFRLMTRFFQQIWTLTVLKRMWAPEAKILLQTALPDTLAIKYIYQDYKRYFDSELAKREMFHYPPQSRLISIFTQNKDKKTGQAEAKQLYEQLYRQFYADKNLQISVPYQPHRQMTRGQYRYYILIKILNDDTAIRSWIKEFLPDYWTIDIDPMNVV